MKIEIKKWSFTVVLFRIDGIDAGDDGRFGLWIAAFLPWLLIRAIGRSVGVFVDEVVSIGVVFGDEIILNLFISAAVGRTPSSCTSWIVYVFWRNPSGEIQSSFKNQQPDSNFISLLYSL